MINYASVSTSMFKFLSTVTAQTFDMHKRTEAGILLDFLLQ